MRFLDKVAIITGSGNGIGKDLAINFAAEGAKVVVCARTEKTVQAVVDEIKSNGNEAIGFSVDVSKSEQVQDMIDKVIAKYGKIDILVNNAGVVRDTRIVKMTEEDWDVVIDTSLKGAYLCTKYVVVHMINQNYGKIVNMSSRSYLGNFGQANYSAAKAGLLGFSNALAKELGKHNITVNSVAPGLVTTELITSHPNFEKIQEAQIKQTPIPRTGTTEDVRKAVMFFASDESEYITGDVLHVTGGRKG